MINRPSLLYELFSILKEAQTPMSQAEIIKKLREKGYSKTTCIGLFQICALQPIFIRSEGDYAEPFVQKIQQPTDMRPMFVLNEKWAEVKDAEAHDRLNGL